MFGFAIGLAIGALLLNLAVEDEHKINTKLKETINNLQEDLGRANFKIDCKNEKINDYQEEHEILLENACEARKKITDLENNVELLKNNLAENVKELISDFDDQN